MSMHSPHDPPDARLDALLERAVDDLAARGYSVLEDALAPAHASALRALAQARYAQGLYRQARVGQGDQAQTQRQIRSDQIAWIEPDDPEPCVQQLLTLIEQLRLGLNRALMMGLVEWEGHLAVYPAGALYQRHLDVFAHARQRQVSTVLYLNEAWQPEHGGQLRLYLDGESLEPFVDVPPTVGKMVLFLSETFYHEVLPSTTPRYSVTGWLRTRGAMPR